MRVPGGRASCLGVGRPGSGALPPPTACPLGGLPGPTTHWLWVRGGAGVGTRHQCHSARSCELALRAVGAARGRPGGGASCLGVGRPGSGALPPPTARPLGGLRGPTTHWLWVRGGAGVGTRHQPHSARSCELALRAVGAARGRQGGAPPAWVWGVRGRALSHPRLPALWAGCRGPLPTGCGCGGVRAWGPITNPTARALASWLCALWRQHEGARGGAPPAWVWGVPARALSHPRLPALWAGCRDPLPTGCGCGGLRAWGPVTNPTVRALASWLCALLGRHEGARGGPLLPGCGASGVGRSPTPDCPPSGRAAEPTTHSLWVRGGAGVGTRHQPHSARSCVLWGRHEGDRGGRLLPGCGASGVGRSPTPDCPPSGRAAGAHYPLAAGAGGCGRGDPSPTPQRALLRAGFARCGGGTRAPGGGASCLGVGRPGSGALPAPTARPLGGLPGPTTYWLWVRGGAGVGTRHQPHSAPLACCGGGMRVPAGGAPCLDVGRPGSGALPPPTADPLGGLRGPTTHWLPMRGAAGVGTRHQPHSARSCELALRAVGAA